LRAASCGKIRRGKTGVEHFREFVFDAARNPMRATNFNPAMIDPHFSPP
jgi:hypothetical protein